MPGTPFYGPSSLELRADVAAERRLVALAAVPVASVAALTALQAPIKWLGVAILVGFIAILAYRSRRPRQSGDGLADQFRAGNWTAGSDPGDLETDPVLDPDLELDLDLRALMDWNELRREADRL